MIEESANPDDSEEFASVYNFVRGIPPGSVVSYGEVGAAVGLGARAVGFALRFAPKNVPWQRVVGAGGRLPIVKRSPDLQALQRSLLEAEGVRFDAKGNVAPDHFWDADPAQPDDKPQPPLPF